GGAGVRGSGSSGIHGLSQTPMTLARNSSHPTLAGSRSRAMLFHENRKTRTPPTVPGERRRAAGGVEAWPCAGCPSTPALRVCAQGEWVGGARHIAQSAWPPARFVQVETAILEVGHRTGITCTRQAFQ